VISYVGYLVATGLLNVRGWQRTVRAAPSQA
jgi:hypothetical protein